VSFDVSPPKDERAQPGAPQMPSPERVNEFFDEPMVSTGSTPERAPNTNTNTNTISGVYTNTIHIQRKDYTASIRVSELRWKSFLQKARELGYSANELINQFINSVVGTNAEIKPHTQLNFNIAIAKADSRPVINVGEYVALKQLNDALAESRRLRDRAEREQCSGQALTFTRERARSLEEGLLKALKSLKSIRPEKLQEVEAALSVLRGIRGGA